MPETALLADESGNYISDENGTRVLGVTDPDTPNENFWLDGVSASSVGLYLQRPVSFSAAVPRVAAISVAGKSGNLHIDLQAFENRTGTAACFVLTENATDKMAEISAFLFAEKGYRKLQLSDDPNHYWEARVANAAEIAARLNLLNPFTIEFDCKPFRRLATGDEEITPENGMNIVNETGFEAEPLIYFTASGVGGINVNSDVVYTKNSMDGTMILDCELWTVYPEGRIRDLSYNKFIDSEYFPVFTPGNNFIQWEGGVTVTKIIPRWRTI